MKILFICHRIPYPPNKGDKIRSFNILRHLAKNHDIYLACLADDKSDLQHKAELKKLCKEIEVSYINGFQAHRRMFCNLIQGRPLTLGYFYSSKLKKTVQRWLNEISFDAIYVFSSGVAQYVMNTKKRKIMDFVDVDSDKWAQNARRARFPASWIYAIESKRMKQYEIMIAQEFAHSVFITENERKLFESFARPRHITVIPNGVDHGYFKRDCFAQPSAGLAMTNGENGAGLAMTPLGATVNLIFTGAMDYLANVDAVAYFCHTIMPLIKKDAPNLKFYIVGNNPTRAVKDLTKNKDVFVTGYVQDIRPYLRKADICVVPLRIARGIQNKILEAMSMELPVVSLSAAAKNLEVSPGTDIFIEDKPQDFAYRVIQLSKDPALRARIGKNARETILCRYDWRNNLRKIEDIIAK